MATRLKRYRDAYATMTIAIYEPLILRWISSYGVHLMASTMAWRAQKARRLAGSHRLPTAIAINTAEYRPRLPRAGIDIPPGPPAPPRPVFDNAGAMLSPDSVQPVDLDGYPDAVMIGDKVYPFGTTTITVAGETPRLDRARTGVATRGDAYVGARTIPTVVSRRLGFADDDFSVSTARSAISKRLLVKRRVI